MQNLSQKQPVTSRENKTIKYLHSLLEPKHRKKEGVFLVEGIKMVGEALREPGRVRLFVAAPSLPAGKGRLLLERAETQSVEILWISERLTGALSESKTPQPVMAVVSMKEYAEEALVKPNPGLFVITHELQDPGNLGTIIRTAEAVGAAGVAVTQNTADPYNARAIRASMGSILRMPVVRLNDLHDCIGKYKQWGFQTVALAISGSTPHLDLDLRKPTTVIVGQEGGGLPEDIVQRVDYRVRIPMSPTIDSLNVATASAVILYEALRQRTL
ncbi:MAG TPA: RNA methyltransferase [Nitrospiraceae bacterium]|nr:RNA methyltransferase [Nitrospiraceae bacterium]